MNTVIVHLKEDEARLLRLLMEAGILGLQDASVQIDFDHNGDVRHIAKTQHMRLSTGQVAQTLTVVV